MNPCATKDRNVVGYQNDTPLESPKTAAKKSEGFQPGDEWEGSAGPGRGNKVRAQNEHVVKSHETAKQAGSGFFMSSSQDSPGGIMHASKMNACTTKD
jgi:hypothetical protein